MTLIDTTKKTAGLDLIEAATNDTNYSPPTLPDLSAPIPLSGMVRNESLNVCERHVEHYSNCVLPKFWLDPCDPAYDGNPDKCTSREWFQELFRPFTFYDVESTPCVDPLIDPQAMADQVVSESTAWALTRVLQDGAGISTASLQSCSLDLSPVSCTALDPCEALAKLIMEMSTRGIGRYTIHAPIWTLPAFLSSGLVRPVGGIYRGPAGVPINFGIGFTGTGPNGTGNIPGSSHAAYVYATRGRVEYNYGPVIRYAPEGTLIQPRWNTAQAEALRQAVVKFDPECAFAIRVCLAKPSCCAGVAVEEPIEEEGEG